MDLSAAHTDKHNSIVDLFTDSFTTSEGAEEGQLIGTLARALLETVPRDDIFVFCAHEEDALLGAIIFTRLRYPEDSRTVFILSPVAVASAHQGKGVGQALIRYGLDALRAAGVQVALTYGDIAFYSKVGFAQITATVAEPPLELSYPQGWLGQSLTEAPLTPLAGPSTCVAALNKAVYW